MKFNLIYIIFASFFIFSCTDSETIEEKIKDPINKNIDPIYRLIADATDNANEIRLRWINPDDDNLIKVEISYQNQDYKVRNSSNPMLLDAAPASIGNAIITIPTSGVYVIQVVAINKAGERSSPVVAEYFAKPSEEQNDHSSIFLGRADSLMSSLIKLCLGGRYDVWNEKYPNATGPYWDGAAAVWGQGAGFSAYTAIRRASVKSSRLNTKYSGYDDRFYTSIEKFRNNLSGRGSYAYGTFMGDNDERFYDDNLWIGIDMADLYVETQLSKYLDRAKMVWKFILEGTDDKMGGGVYWKEGSVSKHTCSTAPAAVLAIKLYQITGEKHYLDAAKNLYSWCKTVLQDPVDYLYWDNARLTDENNPNSSLKIEKTKYSYNSGQPMQVAALLYSITKENHYLIDAQNIAEAAYKQWFLTFKSYPLGETIQILDPGDSWFQAIMFRGYIDLYKVDNNRKYVQAYENTMSHAWLSNCRNRGTNLLNNDFRGGITQDSWGFLGQAACAEILARLALLED